MRKHGDSRGDRGCRLLGLPVRQDDSFAPSAAVVDYSSKRRSSLNAEAKMLADDLFERANKEWDAGRRRQAFRLFSQAAAEGHTSAQNSLGYFFDHGLGVAKNRRKALLWYRKAAKKGDMCASGNLAITYRDAGHKKQAKFWFAKSLAQGDADAALEIAKLYLGGRAPISQKDKKQALRYLAITAKSRDAFEDSRKEAQALLRRLQHAPTSRER